MAVRKNLEKNRSSKKRKLDDAVVTQKKSKTSIDLLESCKALLKQAFSTTSEEGSTHFSELISLLNEEGDDSIVSQVFDLICGHSKFIDVLVNENDVYGSLRKSVIDLLSFCVQRDKAICKMEIMPILLASYTASLSQIDQSIFRLIATYEQNGCELFNLHPSFWGEKAIEYYSIRKDIKLRLVKQPKLDQVLQLYNKEKFLNTIENFPLNIQLSASVLCEGNEDVYDPRFVLLSCYHLLSPHLLVNCDRFVEYRGLSLTIASLSAECKQIRSLGYSILTRFYNHLQSATFNKDRFLWILLIDLIRKSITSNNQKLSSLITIFLVRVIEVLLMPTNNLWQFVRTFLEECRLLTPSLIPKVAVRLLETTDIQKRSSYQRWALKILMKGLKRGEDFKICHSSGVLNLLMTLYFSPLIDIRLRQDILEVLESASKISTAINTLCIESAFLAWIKLAALELRNSEQNEALLMNILTNISLNVWSFCEKNVTEKEKNWNLYPTFMCELLLVMNSLLEASCRVSHSECTFRYLSAIDSALNILNEHSQLEMFRRIIFSPYNISLLITICNECLCCENSAKEAVIPKVISILLQSIDPKLHSIVYSNSTIADIVTCVTKNSHFGEVNITQWLTNLLANERILNAVGECEPCLQLVEQVARKM